MKLVKFGWLWLALIGTLYGIEDSKKHTLRSDMSHIYDQAPPVVDNITEMFTQGLFYGRFRFNSFGYRWKNEVETAGVKIRENHAIAGIGGSMIYKSAYFKGFAFKGGLYMSTARGSLDRDEAYLYKSGKGTLSRYDLLTEGSESLSSFAEAYMEYKYADVSVKAGRQIFVSFLTKSNDTKMIPNTFEGITLNSPTLNDTSLKLAYLTKQKLRDHSAFHHVLAVGDDANDPYARYSENDDTAMHLGLEKSELEAKGIEDKLVIVEVKNNSIENLMLRMNYTTVPQLISSAMLQANYKIYLGDWSVLPALRYMQQFDEGAGAIGGANLRTLTDGYRNPDSLDAALFGARVDLVHDAFRLRFGYTKIADEGDILAPWRGFPTDGFTRAMSQYNWYANTESYMVQLDYEFEDISEFKIISRFAIQDFDSEKIGVQADSNIFSIDFLKGLGASSYYFKTRFAHVMGDDDTIAGNGLTKLDPSYNEVRVEINYLF